MSDDFQLRRLAEEIEHGLQAIENTSRVEVVGGRARQIRVELDTKALAAHQTAPLEVARAIDVSNRLLPAPAGPGSSRRAPHRCGAEKANG